MNKVIDDLTCDDMCFLKKKSDSDELEDAIYDNECEC